MKELILIENKAAACGRKVSDLAHVEVGKF